MSKVQVDTIVDKDDISAPSLTKGAIVTGVCTATSFDGAISEWVLGADGTSHYTFTGSGLTGAENDPTLYLKRGQKYRFKNSSGGHPFRIQSTANGSAGTAYNDGVTNNDAGDGTTLEWDVQFDAPSVLYYQCTAHGSMGGKIYIGNSGNSSTLVDLNVSGVTTTGIATVTTSVVVGSAVTANADGVITAGVGTFGSVVSSGAISGTTGTFTGQLSLNGIGSGDIVSELTTDSPTFTYRNGSGAWFHAGKHPTEDAFIISDGASTTTNERLRVTSAGRVGIGTDDPFTKFDIQEGTTGIRFNRNNNTPELDFKSNTVDEAAKIRVAESLGGGILQFNTKTTGGVDTERIRIGTSGEIGIAGANYGTSGQVLTSAGSGSAVQWADVSAGIWSTLASGTVTSGTTGTITDNGISSSYDMYKIVFSCVSSSYIGMGVDITTDGGSTWSSDTTGWTYSLIGRDSNTNWASNGSGQTAGFFIGGNSKHRFWGEITFNDTQNTATHPSFNFVGGVGDNAASYCGTIMSNVVWPTATAFNGVRWYSAHAAMTNVKWVLLGTTLS